MTWRSADVIETDLGPLWRDTVRIRLLFGWGGVGAFADTYGSAGHRPHGLDYVLRTLRKNFQIKPGTGTSSATAAVETNQAQTIKDSSNNKSERNITSMNAFYYLFFL